MNQIDLQGRIAVVTGGARGIGYAVAERFIASGAKVALWDIDVARTNESAQKLGHETLAVALDLTDETAVNQATEQTLKQFSKIDILVNSAGITGPNQKTWEYSPADFRRVIEVNLVAPYLVSRAIVPHMMKAQYGRIVNIASIAGKEGNPNAPAYSASKAGLIGLTKSLGKELATNGVVVNSITPAAAATEMFSQMTVEHIAYMKSKIPMNRFLEVQEVAAMITWLASEECSFTTGGVFDISGGRATY